MPEHEDGRSGKESSPSGRAGMRLVWQDGPFRVVCAGRQGAMRLTVFEGGAVQAEADVVSAESAYQRGREICARLIRDRRRDHGNHSA